MYQDRVDLAPYEFVKFVTESIIFICEIGGKVKKFNWFHNLSRRKQEQAVSKAYKELLSEKPDHPSIEAIINRLADSNPDKPRIKELYQKSRVYQVRKKAAKKAPAKKAAKRLMPAKKSRRAS